MMTGPTAKPSVYNVSGRSEAVRERLNSLAMAPVAGTVEDVAIVLDMDDLASCHTGR